MTVILDLLPNPSPFIILAAVLVASITIHEFAHAWMADRLWRPNTRSRGRVTLNPLAHLDPVGTIALVLIGFGWGKPVPFDPYNLKKILSKDGALIALALACIKFDHCHNFCHRFSLGITRFSGVQLVFGNCHLIVSLNVMLAIFNLVPVFLWMERKFLWPSYPN